MAKYILKLNKTIGGVILTHYGNKGSQLKTVTKETVLPEHLTKFLQFDNPGLKKINVSFDEIKDAGTVKITSIKGLIMRCELEMDSPLQIRRAEIKRQRERFKTAKQNASEYLFGMKDLLEFFGTDRPENLNKAVFHGTQCGASISLYTQNATAFHNGINNAVDLDINKMLCPVAQQWQGLTEQTELKGFTLQTIIEGSDAEINSSLFEFPVKKSDVTHFISEMEMEAETLWNEANSELETEANK